MPPLPGDRCKVRPVLEDAGSPWLNYIWNAFPDPDELSPRIVDRISNDDVFTVISTVFIETQHFFQAPVNVKSLWLYIIVDKTGAVGWIENLDRAKKVEW